jgi:hypothetical protein
MLATLFGLKSDVLTVNMGLFLKISSNVAKAEVGHNSVAEFFFSPSGVAKIINLCCFIRITHSLGIVSSFVDNIT